MALRAYDAEQTHEWSSPDFPGVKCKIKPLTAREFAECQEGEKIAMLTLRIACRGLVSATGLENADGSERRVPKRCGRQALPEDFFDGFPSDFVVQLAAGILDLSKLEEDDEGNC